ncbi:MAG: CatB-related O-acetyltransferase [Pseudomonadota bacterium]
MKSNSLSRILYSAYFSLARYFLYPGRSIRTLRVMPHVKIGKGAVLRTGVYVASGTAIGDHTFINEWTRIDPGTRSIGKYCSISHNVKIGVGPHPFDFFTTSPAFYEPQRGFVARLLYDEYAAGGYAEIGNDVFIASNAIVLAGVKVGNGAVIAAGSVVTKDVDPYLIVAGVPAKPVRYRFPPETIQKLLDLRWWDLPPEMVARHAAQGFDIEAFIVALANEGRNAG